MTPPKETKMTTPFELFLVNYLAILQSLKHFMKTVRARNKTVELICIYFKLNLKHTKNVLAYLVFGWIFENLLKQACNVYFKILQLLYYAMFCLVLHL